MNDNDVFIERVMRYLDGNLSPNALPAFEKEICEDAEKRQLYRAICDWAQQVHEVGVPAREIELETPLKERSVLKGLWIAGALIPLLLFGIFMITPSTPEPFTVTDLADPEEVLLPSLASGEGLVDEEEQTVLSLSRSFVIEVGHRLKKQEWPNVNLMEDVLVADMALHPGQLPMIPEN